MVELFTDGPFARTGVGRQFERLLNSPLPTADLADLIAFNFLDNVGLKQSLLCDTNVHRRINRILEALQAVQPVAPVLQSASFRSFRNPGVN